MDVLKGKTVLVVDDEPDLREMLASEFEIRGCHVLFAGDGEAAYRLVESGDVDAVVTDLRMPVSGGIELLANIRTRDALRPGVVVITAYDLDISPFDAYRKGAGALITKPFSLKHLVASVCRLVAPPGDRWGSPTEDHPAPGFARQWSDFREAAAGGLVRLGAGGLFLQLQAGERARASDLVNLDIHFNAGAIPAIEGAGTVRWLRETGGGPSYCGVEIEYLTDVSRGPVAEWIRQHRPVSFIPAPA